MKTALIGIALSVLVGALMALAGSAGGALWAGLPLFAICAALAFLIQWLAFLPAYLFQTEKFYDLTGSITYLLLVLLALVASGTAGVGEYLLALMVAVWAIRLGSFLFLRIRSDGKDVRFDRIKPNAPRFLMTWTLQGLWVLMTLSAVLAALTSIGPVLLGPVFFVGALLWLIGFVTEIVADNQKRQFRRDAANQGAFIRSGLWARCRHPNYFGEILLWCGLALAASPALSGWQYVTLVSPVFVYLLLTRISGIPMLEAAGKRRWGDDPQYQSYLENTPRLFPRLFG